MGLSLVALLVAAGCGGDSGEASFKKAGPPPPPKCLERWNEDEIAAQFGRHAYSPGHDSRAARVTLLNEPAQGVEDACLVMFAASESDREYGTLGQFHTPQKADPSGLVEGGWQQVTMLPVDTPQERIALQASGSEKANAALDGDGKLSPLE